MHEVLVNVSVAWQLAMKFQTICLMDAIHKEQRFIVDLLSESLLIVLEESF